MSVTIMYQPLKGTAIEGTSDTLEMLRGLTDSNGVIDRTDIPRLEGMLLALKGHAGIEDLIRALRKFGPVRIWGSY